MSDPCQLGDEVTWLARAGGLESHKTGQVIYIGAPFSGELPPYDPGCWSSESEYVALRDHHGPRRYTTVTYGVIVRVDRVHRVTGEPLTPWYYAPRPDFVRVRRPS